MLRFKTIVFLFVFFISFIPGVYAQEEVSVPPLEPSPVTSPTPSFIASPDPEPTPIPTAIPLPSERMELLVQLLADIGELSANKMNIKGIDRKTIHDRIQWALSTANQYGFMLRGISIGRYKQMAFLASRQTGKEIQFFPDETNPNVWHLRKYLVKAWGAGVKIQFNGGLNIGLIFDWAHPDQYQSRFCQAELAATTLVGVGASFKFNCSPEDLTELSDSLKEKFTFQDSKTCSDDCKEKSARSADEEVLKKSATRGEVSQPRAKVILLSLAVGAGGGFSLSSPVHVLVGKDKKFDFSGLGFVKELLFQVLAEELELDDPTETSH